jgi:amidase
LGGLPVDTRVTEVLEKQRTVFESLGCIVENDEPDLSGADGVFKAWRAWHFELTKGDLLARHRDQMKETVIWNIEEGQKLSGPQLGQAERQRTRLYHRARRFLETFEFLLLPVSQVPPFDVQQRYVTAIDGERMETYIDWMKSCYYISVLGLPSISLPCGFTNDGLPVGLQIVGRHLDDFGVLQLAYAFEQVTRFGEQRPPITA